MWLYKRWENWINFCYPLWPFLINCFVLFDPVWRRNSLFALKAWEYFFDVGMKMVQRSSKQKLEHINYDHRSLIPKHPTELMKIERLHNGIRNNFALFFLLLLSIISQKGIKLIYLKATVWKSVRRTLYIWFLFFFNRWESWRNLAILIPFFALFADSRIS